MKIKRQHCIKIINFGVELDCVCTIVTTVHKGIWSIRSVGLGSA